MPVNPTPVVPGNGGSSEKSLNEILDILASFYATLGSGGIPVDISGTPPIPAVDFTTAAGPISCAGGAQTVTVGNGAQYNAYNLVSVMFDTAVARDVTISIVINGDVRTWVYLAAYTGPYLLLDDKLEGQGFQIRVTVGQYAGSFTYSVTGKAR